MKIGILITFYLLFPALVVYLCYRFPAINSIGPVIICYITGIILGNTGIFPEGAAQVQSSMSELTVVVALPLLLFSMDIRKWWHLAGRTILSFTLATVAILVMASAGYFFLKLYVENSWQIAGMAIGLYTGGTPNLASIKTALGVDPTRFIIVHTYDTVMSAIYIIFFITIAQRFFLTYLPAFKRTDKKDVKNSAQLDTEDIHSYAGMFSKRVAFPLLGALALSVAIVGISVLASLPVSESYKTSVVILTITTLGILASLVPKVRNIKKSFQLGMYIIYVFSLVVSSMANYKTIININIGIMIYVAAAIFGTMLLHSLLCKLFKIDVDTFIITSTSAICSPPFVPVVAAALKNKEIILSGITTGIIGYAIGNYLGISFGLILKNWF